MNCCALIGTVATTPKTVQLKGDVRTTFTLRVSQRGAQVPCLVDVQANGKLAQFAAGGHLFKGQLVSVIGQLLLEQWVSQENVRHSKHNIRASTIEKLA